MSIGEFLFWVGVALTAVALAGVWKLSWQFIGSVWSDLLAAWKAYQARDTESMSTHLDRLSLKGLGCTCVVVAVTALFAVGAVVLVVVLALDGQLH